MSDDWKLPPEVLGDEWPADEPLAGFADRVLAARALERDRAALAAREQVVLPPPRPPRPRRRGALLGLTAIAVVGSLARAIAELTPEQRATFLLREVHELSYEEVSAALEVDLGTVKSRLSRAKQALRVALAEVHDE